MNKSKVNCLVIFLLTFLTTFSVAQQDVGDLVICIDASGSMRFPFPTVVGTSYGCDNLPSIAYANARYRVFLRSILSTLSGASARVISDVGPSDDLTDGSVGVVRFPKRVDSPGNKAEVLLQITSGQVETPTDNPFDSVIPNILSDYDDSDITKNMQISCNVNGTPIGDALNLSKDQLAVAPTGKDKQAILLITDGENNRAPFYSCSGGSCTYDTELSWISAATNQIRIDAIGIGDETGSKYEDLQALTKDTGGHLYAIISDNTDADHDGQIDNVPVGAYGVWWDVAAATDPAEMAKKQLRTFLDDHLFISYLNYTPLTDPTGILDAFQLVEDSVLVTTLDKSIVFAVHWNPYRGLFHPNIRVIFGDGNIINADSTKQKNGYRIVRGFDHVYILVGNSLLRKYYGHWRLQIDGSQIPIEIPYSYSIYTLSDLEITTDFNRAVFLTGDSFSDNIQIMLNGQKIKSALGNITIRTPEDWVGNWNNNQTLTPAEFDSINEGSWEADMPLLSRKRILLERNRNIVFLKNKKYLSPIRMSETEGNYNFRFDKEISVPGLYEFTYEFTGEDPKGNPFKRELFFQKYISINVDSTWKHSIIKFEKVAKDGNMITVDIKTILKDKFGNVVLPDQIKKIKIEARTVSGDILQGPVVDPVDGSYTKRITYDEREGKPLVSVSFGGVKFPDRIVELKPKDGLRTKITPFAGYFKFDEDLPVKDGVVLGLRVGRDLTRQLCLEAEAGITLTKDKGNNPSSGIVIQGNLNLLYWLNNSKLNHFLTVGGGILSFQKFNNDDTGAAFKFGYGAVFNLSNSLKLRLDLRDFVGLNIYGIERSHNLQATMGLMWEIK